jgi:hypothetical protein
MKFRPEGNEGKNKPLDDDQARKISKAKSAENAASPDQSALYGACFRSRRVGWTDLTAALFFWQSDGQHVLLFRRLWRMKITHGHATHEKHACLHSRMTRNRDHES